MTSPEPPSSARFARLAAQLREDILTGKYTPGALLPSETVLQQLHGISRQTARAVLRELRDEGLASRRSGLGTYVRELPQRQGLTPPPGATVISRMPSAQERADLGIDQGVPLFEVATTDGDTQLYPADRYHLTWPR